MPWQHDGLNVYLLDERRMPSSVASAMAKAVAVEDGSGDGSGDPSASQSPGSERSSG